ncbi:MAG: hypothetical protein ACE5FF_02915 [Saprospiraceae bacterium]
MKLVSNIRGAGWCLTVVAFVLAPLAATANGHEQQAPTTSQDTREFTKTIIKEFPLNPTGTVNLKNKYGKVNVKTWEKNRAKIDVTIVVKARSESAAQEVFDRIHIDFANDRNFVKAETVIESSKSSFFDWGWGNSRSEFQINYEVFMPSDGSLELSNKYGDANVEPINGRAEVKVKYGNFRLEGVGEDLDISLGYGHGTVVKARDVHADIAYGNINFTDVQDVSMATKYSKIIMDKAVDLNAESRYDHFNLGDIRRFNCQSRYGNVEIGKAKSVVAVGKYTDFRINHLVDNGDFDLQYGGLVVDNLERGFSNVNLTGKYTDFKIYVEGGASYVLDATSNYAGIAYPASLSVTYEKEKGTSHEVKGHAGTAGARSVIKANLNYGGLKVRQ